ALPETRAPADAPWRRDTDEWILKAAFANTGEGVLMRAAMSSRAWTRCAFEAWLRPSAWVAQRRFEVTPVESDAVPYQPSVGVYAVGGRAGGAYGGLAGGPIVAARALDAPLLVASGA